MIEKSLLDKALKLSRKKRAVLADKLLESLEEERVLDSILEEGERRWEAYLKGEVKGIPAEEVFPELARRKRKS